MERGSNTLGMSIRLEPQSQQIVRMLEIVAATHRLVDAEGADDADVAQQVSFRPRTLRYAR
jgi:hypothetical protein